MGRENNSMELDKVDYGDGITIRRHCAVPLELKIPYCSQILFV